MKVRNTEAHQSPKLSTPESATDRELRETSRNWTSEQWEEYLRKLEGSLKEELLPIDHYGRIAEEHESIFENVQKAASPAVIQRVHTAIDGLTNRQRQVVELIYLNLKTESEAALELGIGRASVRVYRRRGEKNLRKIMLGVSPTFPLVEGQKKKTGGIK